MNCHHFSFLYIACMLRGTGSSLSRYCFLHLIQGACLFHTDSALNAAKSSSQYACCSQKALCSSFNVLKPRLQKVRYACSSSCFLTARALSKSTAVVDGSVASRRSVLLSNPSAARSSGLISNALP